MVRKLLLAAIFLFASLPGPAFAGPKEDADAAYVRGDYQTAIQLLRPLAEQGSANAQYNLGVIYADGLGVPQDNGEAIRWYRLAADQGEARAQHNLGVRYESGEGVGQNYAEAERWYLLAAAQGLADAQYYLANIYFEGKTGSHDLTSARKWYELAAKSLPPGKDRDTAETRSDLVKKVVQESSKKGRRD